MTLAPDDDDHIDDVSREVSDSETEQTDHLRAGHDYSQLFPQLDVGRLFPDYSQLFPQLDVGRLFPDYSTLLDRLIADVPDFSAIRRRFHPQNWHGVKDDNGEEIEFGVLLELAKSGIPTAWIPSAPILEVLIKASEDRRSEVILDHEAQILEDCLGALADVDGIPHLVRANWLIETIEAAKHQLYGPAQAAAASLLDTVIREAMSPWKGYREFLKQHLSDDDFQISQLRYVTAMAPIRLALQEFWPQKGDPIPTIFNRHATSHAVGKLQCTPLNAIVGIMLATSIVREFFEQGKLPARN